MAKEKNKSSEIINLEKRSEELKEEIKNIKSKQLKFTDREQTVLNKLKEIIALFDQDITNNNDTLLLYKERELEMTEAMIKRQR